MIQIVVIDDHILLRDMIVDTLNSENDFKVVGVSDDAQESIEMCKNLKPDILIMDICTANNSNGVSYAKLVKEIHPDIKIIIMTGVLDISFINESKDAGIESFIYKSISKDSLIATVRNTANGYSMYPNSKSDQDIKNNILSKLTNKEIQVLTLYCKLLDKDEVAEALSISLRTLKSHIHSIYEKTGFNNLNKLAIYCVSNGFIVANLEDPKEQKRTLIASALIRTS